MLLVVIATISTVVFLLKKTMEEMVFFMLATRRGDKSDLMRWRGRREEVWGDFTLMHHHALLRLIQLFNLG